MARDRYIVEEWSGYYDGVPIAFLTANKKYDGQGNWCVAGVPAGGFSVYPLWWLSEEERDKHARSRMRRMCR